MRATKLLIFVTAMIFMLNQTHFLWVYEYLEYGQLIAWAQMLDFGRWLTLSLFCIVIGLHTFTRQRLRAPHAFDAVALLFLGLSLFSTIYSDTPEITFQRGM